MPGPHRARRRPVAALVAAAVALAVGPVALAAAAPAAGDAPPPVTVRLANYNVHAGAGSDNVYDLARTAAAIRALDADVVGLQEADVHWGARSRFEDTVAELGDLLGMRTGFAPIYDLDPLAPGEPRRQYGVAILSRHPIVALENHDLTRLSTQDPNPVPAPAPGFLEATLEIQGSRVHAYVTHLDYRGDPSVRTVQAVETAEIMAEDPTGANQVLFGDFNAEAAAPELAPLWVRLQDAWAVAEERIGEPGLTYPSLSPTKRIDFITTTRGLPVLSAETVVSPAITPASDHLPVVATVQLARGSETSP